MLSWQRKLQWYTILYRVERRRGVGSGAGAPGQRGGLGWGGALGPLAPGDMWQPFNLIYGKWIALIRTRSLQWEPTTGTDAWGRMCAVGVHVWMNLTQFHINQKCSHRKTRSRIRIPFVLSLLPHSLIHFPRVHLAANRISIVETNCELNEVLKFQQPSSKVHWEKYLKL